MVNSAQKALKYIKRSSTNPSPVVHKERLMKSFSKFVFAFVIITSLSIAKAQDPVSDRAAVNVRRGLATINDEYEAAERKYNDAKQKAQAAASAVTSAEAKLKSLIQQREAIEEDLKVIKEDRINETIVARDAAAAEIDRLNDERAAAITAGKKNTDTEVVEIDKQLAEGSTKLCDAEAAILKAKETYRTTNLRLQESLKSRLAGYGSPTIQQLLENDLSDAQTRENEQKTKLGSPSSGSGTTYTGPTGLYVEKEKTEADEKVAKEEFERVERRLHRGKQTVDGGEIRQSLQGLKGDIRTGFSTLGEKIERNTEVLVTLNGNVVELKQAMKEGMEELAKKFGDESAKTLTKLAAMEVSTKAQADAVGKILNKCIEDLRAAGSTEERLKALEAIEKKVDRAIDILQNQPQPVVAPQDITAHVYHCNQWIQVAVRTKKS